MTNKKGALARSRLLPVRPEWARPSEKRAPTSPRLLEYSFLTSRFSVSRTPRTILCILTSSSSLGSFISSATHSCRVFLLSGSYAPPKPVVSRRKTELHRLPYEFYQYVSVHNPAIPSYPANIFCIHPRELQPL